jgi:hypothetical protein
MNNEEYIEFAGKPWTTRPSFHPRVLIRPTT